MKTFKQNLIHFFVQQKELYLTLLPQLKEQLQPNGAIWVFVAKKILQGGLRFYRRFSKKICYCSRPGRH